MACRSSGLHDLATPAPDLMPTLPTAPRALRCRDDASISFSIADELSALPAATIEMWINPTSAIDAVGNETALGEAQDQFAIELEHGGRTTLPTLWTTLANNRAGVPSDNMPGWRHVAMQYTRAANGATVDFRYFEEGLQEMALSYWPEDIDRFNPSTVFACRGAGTNAFNGEIDALRISNVARYDGDFEPAPYLNDTNTVVLVHFDDLPLTDDSPTHRPISTSGDIELVATEPR